MSDSWGEPASGSFVKAQDLAGHLIIAWPIGYVPHIQTQYTRPDKKSDAIQVDIVDLDAQEDDGTPGRVHRNCNMMQAKLIQDLRPRIGGRLLGTIVKGLGRNGNNPPWIFQSLTGDPQAVARANKWLQENPDFTPSEFAPMIQAPPPPQYQQPMPQYQGPPPTQYQQQPPQYQPPAPPASHWDAPEHTYTYPPQQAQVPVPQYQQSPQPQYLPQQAQAPIPQPQVPPQYQVPAAPVQGSAQVSPEEMSMLQRLRAQQQQGVGRPDSPEQGAVPF
jgi:hypothetical protein